MRLVSWAVVMLAASVSQAAVIERQADAVVYGNTSAGVIASCALKRLGKSVLVVDPGHRAGGMSSGGLGLTDIGNKYVVKGLSRDFFRRVGRHYGRFEQWVFEPSVAEAIFDKYQREADVEVLYGRYAVSAGKDVSGAVDRLITVSMDNQSDTVAVKARMFIDCSYEGDLLPLAGVAYTVGREDNSVYGETVNGVQMPVYHQFPDGVDPYRVKGDPSSGLLWGISDSPVAPSGSGDRKVQAYNYRITLTDSIENRIEITRPEGYDSTRYELMLRVNEVKPWRTLNDMFIWSLMPGRKTDINNRGAFSTDMIGANFDYPEASWPERRRIIAEHEAYTKGMLYFLGHDERVPSHIREQMLQWGYPADEYVANGHWTPQLYIREARRMVSDMVMTQHHCQGRAMVSDPVAMAAYTMDSHNCDRHVIDGMVKNEGDVEVGGFPPYPISYRSLVPARGECPNLLVPVCLSASHIAYGSIRMEPVFMGLAQVAAMAAVQAIDRGIAVQDVDSRAISERFRTDPLLDGSAVEVLVDNSDRDCVVKQGRWHVKSDAKRAYGPDYSVADPAVDGQFSMTFRPERLASGEYDIYMYMPRLVAGQATAMTVDVYDGTHTRQVALHPSAEPVLGQTYGEWIPLGRVGGHPDVSVTVSQRGANGTVVADAILFVPSPR